MRRTSFMQRRTLLRGLAGGAAMALGLPLAAATLEEIKARGSLKVALYDDLPPFHAHGKGIDAELAAALAQALGVKLSVLPFPAGEAMNDDLRNMVWKGHYLGYGPADVLLHVPVDRPLMQENPQVSIFGPYWRERVAIARRTDVVPKLESLSQLGSARVAVPGQSLAGWLLIGADSGAYKQQLTTTYKDGVEAAQALQRGEVPVAAGNLSELQSVLRGQPGVVIEALPSPRAPREGWAVGMAVKKDATELAQALQGALNELTKNGQLAAMFERHNVNWHAV